MADQLARGIFANFAAGQNPWQAINGMEQNLRLIDDHLGLYTLVAPVAPGTLLPATPVDGDGQIYTDGTYAVFNGGVWKQYPARKGIIAVLSNGTNAWVSSGGAWINLNAGALAALAAASGASLLGFLQAGAGAVQRTMQDKGRDTISVRDYITTSIDGVTSNQAGIVAAVAYAYSTGSRLDWPAGLYVSDDTIPNFHDVQHSGPGRIKRNIDIWTISGKNATNIIYVAKTGNDSNDGLSALKPKLTVQSAFDALKNWTTALLNDGVFRVQFGVGTWTESASLVGLRSKNRIEFLGANVGSHPNVPTTIINGTGQGTVGWYFQQYMLTKVQNIKFTNWSIHGLVSELHSNLWTVNVHTAGNGWNDTSNGSGIDAESNSRLYVSGGIHNNTGNTVRLYANCVGTIGYQGTDTTNRPQITGATGGNAGVLARDNSSAHVDYCDITGCSGSGGGVYGLNQARIHILNSTITGNYYNVRLDANSTYINTGSAISGATTGKDVVQFGMSLDNDNLGAWYFDRANVRWRLGLTSNLLPQAMVHEVNGAGAGAISYGSASRHIIEGDSSVHLVFGTPGGVVEAGIVAAKPGSTLLGKIIYNYSDDSWRMNLNSAENYRFTGAGVLPLTDNARSLGASGNRWSQLYAGNGTINTSDQNEKTSFIVVPDAMLDAWGEVRQRIGLFQWLGAVAEKGTDAARWHVGIPAQAVDEAFARHGIDARRYGLFCEDEIFEPVKIKRMESQPVTELIDVQTEIFERDGGSIVRKIVMRQESREVMQELPVVDEYGDTVMDAHGAPLTQRVPVCAEQEVEEVVMVATGRMRLGLRPDQCMWLEAAFMRRELDRLKGAAA